MEADQLAAAEGTALEEGPLLGTTCFLWEVDAEAEKGGFLFATEEDAGCRCADLPKFKAWGVAAALKVVFRRCC